VRIGASHFGQGINDIGRLLPTVLSGA